MPETAAGAQQHRTDGRAPLRSSSRRGRRWAARLRFLLSWLLALAIVVITLPHVLGVSWASAVPVLRSLPWVAGLELFGLWFLGLYVHSFVLTAAAPRLNHRRALTLNVTGSAVANLVPLGGAAGVELNRRMMRSWGLDARSFTGFTFLTNLWDVGSKLLLPLVAALALARAGETVTPQLRTAALVAGSGFVGLVAVTAALLVSARGTAVLGRTLERTVRSGLRVLRRNRELHLVEALHELRRECACLVAKGWVAMSAGIGGYVALQWLLLALCLHFTGAGVSWQDALAAFAIERLLTLVPVTPGGVGVADLGLVGVLLALGGNPVGITAAAVLYRLFIFAIEIPVGGGVLGAWLLSQRQALRLPVREARHPGELRRVAHVTDVFLPRLGGIETHVDDLVRHQRDAGIDAQVLTPTARATSPADPPWVRRLSASRARRLVAEEYDVVHVHVSVWSPFGLAVARAAIAAGLPTLITVHSMWAGAGGIFRLAAMATLRRWPVAWTAVSAAAAQTFQRSLRGSRVDVLPNAVDVSAWQPPATAAAAQGPTPASGRIIVVSVMRLMPRKRPLALLQVYEQASRLVPDRDLELVIVGDGPLRGRVERHLARRGLTPHVRITGRIPRDQVRAELMAASLYLAPAPKESFGIAALEARCAGLPVIASSHSGVGEFIEHGVSGLLVGSDAAMATALAALVSDDHLRARIAEHNRRTAPTYDWQEALRRTDALYWHAVELVANVAPVSAPAVAHLAAGI